MSFQDDQEWYRQIKKGNEEAIEALWKKLYTWSVTLAYDGASDTMFAHEAAANAYDRIINKGLAQYKGLSMFETYCYSILIREFRRLLRKYPANEEDIDNKAEILGILDKEPEASLRLILARLQPCIDALPRKLREVIQLMYFQELTPDQAADILKIARNYVNVLAHRARKALRKCLEEQGFSSADDVKSL